MAANNSINNRTSTLTVDNGLVVTTGTTTINSGTSALGISTDASATTVSLATGAAVKTVTLGSTNSTSATTVQSGSGACNLGTTGTGATNIGNTTGTTTIQFGASSALSDYKTGTWTPTLDGTTPGMTTYVAQTGIYIKIGNLVWIHGSIVISAATGTGDAVIGDLPYTAINSGNVNARISGSINAAGWSWPASTTYLSFFVINNSTTAKIQASGSGVASANVQMTNAAATIAFSGSYTI